MSLCRLGGNGCVSQSCRNLAGDPHGFVCMISLAICLSRSKLLTALCHHSPTGRATAGTQSSCSSNSSHQRPLDPPPGPRNSTSSRRTAQQTGRPSSTPSRSDRHPSIPFPRVGWLLPVASVTSWLAHWIAVKLCSMRRLSGCECLSCCRMLQLW